MSDKTIEDLVRQVAIRAAGRKQSDDYVAFAASKITQAILDALPEKESETSEFHTSDMNYISSTGIQLERNKGFNKAVDQIRTAIKKMGGSDE